MSVSTSIGPISGIDYGKLITGLIGIEQQPIDRLNAQIATTGKQSDALLTLSALLTNLKLSAANFTSSAIFRSTTATSSNPSVLSASSTIGSPAGSYSFNVQRLASTSQLATQGFASATTAIGDSGVLPVSADARKLNQPLKLSDLNGGNGVAAGSISITTTDGVAHTVDLSSAATIKDVADTISGAGINVAAAIKGDRLVLTDTNGGGDPLTVANTGGTTTASDLKLTGLDGSSGVVTSGDINVIQLSTSLASLNGGNGVRTTGSSLPDFSVTVLDKGVPQTFKVSLQGSTTVGDVVSKINAASQINGGQSLVSATVDSSGHGIELVDPNGGTITVAALSGSQAARDLGLTTGTQAGAVYHGDRINAGLSSALLRELNAGSGLNLGTISITNRNGVNTTANLSSARTVDDLLTTINTATASAGLNVTAGLSADSTAITLTDASGGTGNFIVNDTTGTAAVGLGLTSAVAANTITGKATQLRALGSGTFTFQLGRGALDDVAQLSDLNGGKGVSKGAIRITDRAGIAATVDLSKAVDLQDVVDTINSASNINVLAAIGGAHGDQLVLTDRSGGSGSFSVANVGAATTATDLGLTSLTATADPNTFTGSDLNKLSLTTSLDLLNNKNGVRVTGGIQTDFSIAYTGGSVNVSLGSAKTLGDVLSAINAAANVGGVQKVTAALSADGHGITLTAADAGTGGTVTLSALNSSNALRDLGLTGTATAGAITGQRINNATNSPLLSELNGGSGVRLGTINFTNRAGVASAVDLSSAQTVQDVINAINNPTTGATGVTASLNSASNAIVLTDTTGNTAGTFSVTGNTAVDLGLAQSVSASNINGSNLHLRVISNNTLLSALGGGAGFKPGQIKITDAKNQSYILDLSSASLTTVGDILNKINNTLPSTTRASINATGNGILLTDTNTGTTVTAKVEEVNGGSTAASLNLLGSFTGNTLNGSFEKSVTILGTDSLTDIANKITNANVGISAGVINDGSGATPFRLNLSSRNSGSAGQLLFDGSALGLTTTRLVKGQDAVVSYGGTSTGAGLTAVSSSNTLTSLVPGLTINLASVGSATVSVARDDSKISDTVQAFVDSYNKVASNIADVTKFDVNDQTQNGVLFGNSTVQQVQQGLGAFVGHIFTGVGALKTLSAAGITINQDGTLALDTSKLQSTLSTSPDDLRSLFTAKAGDATHPNDGGVGVVLSNVIAQFTDAQTGLIFHATDALTTQTQQLNDRVSNLNDLLTAKKNRLIEQFANLEVSIAKLQQQGSAISNYKPVSVSTSSSSSSG